MKKFKLATLGCRTNQYETEALRKQLLELGRLEAAPDEEADLCIVNTCTVTASADKSSLRQIRLFAAQNPQAQIVVTGCLAETLQEDGLISRIVLNKDKKDLIQLLYPEETIPEFSIKQFEAHTRAFVKVQDGCNSFCTYCIIPYVRGRSVSRKIEEVLVEVEALVASGFQDVVITGINVGDFEDGEETLADLIRSVDQISGLKRLRLSSIDPDEVDEELMGAILEGKNTCHSLHLVLQSGSNVVLKRMNRKYTRHIFLQTVEALKKASADFTFTTDVIVGFPGETETDFEETLDVMRTVQFAKVHMFPYSRRERTRAALYPHQVPESVIQERKSRVLRLAEETAFALREQFVGRTMSVLTEQSEGEFLSGHTENFLAVHIPRAEFHPNQIIDVFLKENTPQGLIGLPQL